MYTRKQVHKYTRVNGIRNTPRLSPISYLLSSLLILTIFLTSCGPDPAPATQAPPFSGRFQIVTTDPNSLPTPFGPVTSTSTLIPTPTSTPTQTATPVPPTLTPIIVSSPVTPPPVAILARPLYTLYATIDYDNHTVDVDQSILYPNHTGATLNELVLAVEPMLYTNAFSLASLSVDGQPVANYSLVTHRLTVPLSPPLPPGGQVNVVLEYGINIPVKQRANTFGWLSYQTNLTDWYPFIVPYDASAGWLLHDFMPFGEHLVYDSSDFDVNLRFVEQASPPVIAAAALPEVSGEWTRYRLNAARTFALSMSREFLVNESAVGPTVIRTYYFAGHEDAASKMTYVATQEVGLFNPKFGQYPYPVLNVVELDYNDGQEYDGLAFLSSDFFESFSGGVKNNLTTIGVHEIAHNWWFGMVGNDQALEPWLDEAMALYSERIFYEYTNPDLVDWWWQFRVNYFGPNGWVDMTLYEGVSFRDYTNAVYLNGATFLEDLRLRVGDEAFFKFLKGYAAQMTGRRATANDFFAVLRQYSTADISDLLAAYFSKPH